jgi:hypothetical protein
MVPISELDKAAAELIRVWLNRCGNWDVAFNAVLEEVSKKYMLPKEDILVRAKQIDGTIGKRYISILGTRVADTLGDRKRDQ